MKKRVFESETNSHRKSAKIVKKGTTTKEHADEMAICFEQDFELKKKKTPKGMPRIRGDPNQKPAPKPKDPEDIHLASMKSTLLKLKKGRRSFGYHHCKVEGAWCLQVGGG